uniref:PIN domain-containing protein n=1 Tax=Altererythrobacter segetis TaxID=1104773 RepID=UPI00140AD2A1|nr:PIN domain-containing protein [Altererythrobacter segetis]
MAATHLFIDTSTFLTFYAFTTDDLEELKKVAGLIKANKLKLYIPEQVMDEFYRNRESKLAQSLDLFMGGGGSKSVPRFMHDYPEAEAFRDALKELQKARDALATKAKSDAAQRLLPADSAFATIIEAAGIVKAEEALLIGANRRRLRGNPPGKRDSVGDQINWETLLKAVPDGADLHIVSKDGDYKSALDPTSIHQFLASEWKQKKGSEITLHAELRPFLNATFPNIKLALDIEKQVAIDKLIYSGSFSDTHSAIAVLKGYVDAITWEEAKAIFDAGIANNQINWIGTDTDVNEFYRPLMAKFHDKTDFAMDMELDAAFPPPEEPPEAVNDDDDIPF